MADDQEKPKSPDPKLEPPPHPPFDPEKWDEGRRRARFKNNGGRARDWDFDVFGV